MRAKLPSHTPVQTVAQAPDSSPFSEPAGDEKNQELQLPMGPLQLGKGSAIGSTDKPSVSLTELRTAPLYRAQVKAEALKSLRAAVADRQNIQGTGLEVYGKGDPELLRRRAAVKQLLAADTTLSGSEAFTRDTDFIGRLEATDMANLPFTDAAVEALQQACATGLSSLGAKYTQTVALLANPSASRGDVIKEVTRAITEGGPDARAFLEPFADAFYWRELKDALGQAQSYNAQKSAEFLANPSTAFFAADPQTFSVAVVSQLADAGLRDRTLLDLVLQFRAPIDTRTEKRRLFAGGAPVQAVLELRQMLAALPVSEARTYALARAVALSNPLASSNTVLEARHTVGALRRESWQLVYGGKAIAPGSTISPYAAIHHNFSTETPKVIAAFIERQVFNGPAEAFLCAVRAMGGDAQAQGQLEQRFPAIAKELAQFSNLSSQQGRARSEVIESFLVARSSAALDSTNDDDPTLSAAEKENLKAGASGTTVGNYKRKLELCARLYTLVCQAMPTAETISDNMFSAGAAWPVVADVVAALKLGEPNNAVLSRIATARAEIREVFNGAVEGHVRLDVLKLDQKLEQLSASVLGDIVAQTGDLSTDAQKSTALFGMRDALRNAALSGLADLTTGTPKGATLAQAIASLEALCAQPTCSLEDYRNTMGEAYAAVVATTENIRQCLDERVPDVSNGVLVPNPAIVDDFIKESPLHYARALAQKALSVGLKQEITATSIIAPDGVSVLNGLGRVVFDRVIIAEDMKELKELGATRNDFCIVRTMDEKKMMAVGGIMSDFPGGYCHAAVYARGAGMAALSSANISGAFTEFAAKLQGQKLYYSDENGSLVLMGLNEAKARGVVRPGEEVSLKPGANRHVKYLGWSEAEAQWKTIGEHQVMVSANRPVHEIEIFTPADTVRGLGKKCLSFEEAGALSIDGRGLGGEKNTVLSMMAVEPELAALVPEGSYITTTRCFDLLDKSGVGDDWRAVFDKDPYVGRITDANFTESKFYTDAHYREVTRTRLFKAVTEQVTAALVNPDGTATKEGAELMAELRSNPRLASCENWIIRSSYSAEDRPYKSGAGQYDSFPNVKTDAEILTAVAMGLASAWDEPPIENNVAEEYNLRHIQPSLTAMRCLKPAYSGVLVSRDTDTGYRRTVSYQTVRGFGGGVEDGITEEGRISPDGQTLKRTLPGTDGKSLLSPEIATQLYKAGMRIERMFHDKVEAGKGFAVDVEWAFDEGEQKLYIVQARTVRA